MTVPALKLLLVDETANRKLGLLEALQQSGYTVVGVLSSMQDLDEQVRALAPDVILIEADSPDRDTLEHLSVVLAGAPRPVVLGASSDDPEFIRAAVRAGVSAYVVDGIGPARLQPILTEAVARFEALQALRAERDSARAAVADRTVVERAKGILMRERRCDEDTAYRMMRKLAQERSLRLVDLAAQILQAARHLRE